VHRQVHLNRLPCWQEPIPLQARLFAVSAWRLK
jgi:hypothetical protein